MQTKNVNSAIFIQKGTVLDSQPMLCCGENIIINSMSEYIEIGQLFVTPTGNVIVCDVYPSVQKGQALRSWDSDVLDDIASDYFHGKRGKSYRMIDAMAHAGYLTYQDKQAFTTSVNENLRKSNYLVISD